jgi:hypothetical protein
VANETNDMWSGYLERMKARSIPYQLPGYLDADLFTDAWNYRT